MLRPFDYNQSDYATEPDWAGPGTVRDSLGMMVCAANASDPASGNATTCACSQWDYYKYNSSDPSNPGAWWYCEVGPGWKPAPETIERERQVRHIICCIWIIRFSEACCWLGTGACAARRTAGAHDENGLRLRVCRARGRGRGLGAAG